MIKEAVAGDSIAFRQLVQAHQSSVRGFLKRALRGDSARADDLAQEVFLLAFKHLKDFRFESSLSTWLRRIAYNVYVDEFRKQVPTSVAMDIEEPTAPATHPELRVDLQRALNQLREEERMAVILTVIEEWTHEEASESMKIPLGTLKSHALRGRKNLATLLSRMGWEVSS